MSENQNITILVVDDEEGIRDIMAMHFELEGFNVIKASGGKEALEIIKKTNIDFVMSDVRMPEGDGYSLLKDIKAMNLDLPTVLLITGFAEVSRDEVIQQGGLDLMHKPPEIETIISLIKENCAHKLNKAQA